MERVAVLLGAGASVDAGLPLTFQLAEMLVARANSDADGPRGRQSEWVRALNFVYGSMIGHQAADGGNPLNAVNIERLISALRLLQNTSGHEVAPFVGSWKPGALGVGSPSIDRGLGRDFLRALDSGPGNDRSHFFAEQPVADSIAAIARAASGRGNPRAFVDAEKHILLGLADVLGELSSVDYLQPLAELAGNQSDGLDVITLNYDLAVERMAEDAGVSVDRGIERWAPGRPLAFESRSGNINLYKLHGSLDWMLTSPANATSAPAISIKRDEDGASWSRPTLPWIVVGEREKLATDGPTLVLLRAAEDALFRATHLAVVGYSFGDRHINELIRNWLLGSPTRTISVLDPNWRSLPGRDHFVGALLREYGADLGARASGRVVPIEETTADGLRGALSTAPASVPDPYFSVEREMQDDRVVHHRISLLGPDLTDVNISVHVETGGVRGRLSRGLNTYLDKSGALIEDGPSYTNSWRPAVVEHWPQGESISVYSRSPEGVLFNSLSVWANRPDAQAAASFNLTAEQIGGV